MSNITDFMEYSEVRAVLGLSEFELSDDTLDLPMHARQLDRKLRLVTGVYKTQQSANLLYVFNDLLAQPTLTGDEQEFLEMIQQFALYSVAVGILPGLSLTALKASSDGKTTETRFSSEKTFVETQNLVKDELDSLTLWLWGKMGVEVGAAPILAQVTSATDRVTG